MMTLPRPHGGSPSIAQTVRDRSMSLLLLLLLAWPDHRFALAACPDVGGTMTLSGACTLSNLKTQGCDPVSELGLSSTDVQNICDNSGITFGSISNNYYQFDKSHMDGGGHWNTGQENLANGLNLKTDAARIGRFANNVALTARINWPIYEALNNWTDQMHMDMNGRRRDLGTLSTRDANANYNAYMSNFNLNPDDTASCQLNTVMCCFIKNRLNPNSFVSNANVCAMDLANATHSNHLVRGYGTYDSTTPAYCTGFTWSTSATDPTNRFKGNALFDVAYNTVYQSGYVENIPGAPMCACLEQMPVVTKADCRQVKVAKEGYIVSRPGENEMVISPDTSKTSISYSNCASDLKTAAQNVFRTDKDKKDQIAAKIVGAGQCPTANAKFLNEQFWVSANASDTVAYTTTVDSSVWTQFAGLGTYFFPVRSSLDDQDTYVRSLLGSGPPYPLVFRICPSCKPSHQFIYYKRLTQFPSADDLNVVNLFLNNFTTVNSTENPNVIGKDFQLYSSLTDATKGTNPWTYCNTNNNEDIGFPGSCGPADYTDCQWVRYNNYMCDWQDYNGWLHGFFVQKKTKKN